MSPDEVIDALHCGSTRTVLKNKHQFNKYSSCVCLFVINVWFILNLVHLVLFTIMAGPSISWPADNSSRRYTFVS